VKQRIWWTAVAALLAVAPAVAAQLEPVGVPKGTMRIEFGAGWSDWDSRFSDGHVQPWTADFAKDSNASNAFPEFSAAEQTLSRILARPGSLINLGRTTSTALVNYNNAELSLALGLTRHLTIFGRLPMVHNRVQPTLTFTGDSVGFNQASGAFGTLAGAAANNAFLGDFRVALDTLSARVQAGFYDGNTAQKALAIATVADGTLLQARLDTLTRIESANTPFLPIEQSGTGQALLDRVEGVQAAMDTLAVTFTDTLPLPTTPLAQGDFYNFISNPAGPIDGFEPAQTSATYLGNISVGATYTLVDHWDSGRHLGGLRSALSGTLTLPTALLDNANNFFDASTGLPGYSVLGSLITDLGAGRWGARIALSYDWRFATLRVRRVGLPTQPLAYLYRLSNLSYDAGDTFSAEARPFFRLARSFALAVGVRYSTQGTSTYTWYAPVDAKPGLDPQSLGVDSQRSWTDISVGVSYSSAATRGGGTGLPVESAINFGQTVSASGGAVPKATYLTFNFRLYLRLWH
jgi:hypothetical protein